MKNRFMLGILVCLLIGPLTVSASELSDRLNRAMSSLDSLKADFKQTLLDDQQKVISQSMGSVAISRPGKFYWKYSEPYVQEIISDGKELWVYDVDLDQVTVKPVESGLSTAPILILMKKQDISEAFEVHEVGQHKILYWVELVPIEEDLQYSRIYLGMEGDTIKAMELRDSFGQATRIVFENMHNQVIFAPDTFHFTPPEGVDVFGAGG